MPFASNTCAIKFQITLALYDCQYSCNQGPQVWITGHPSCRRVGESLRRSDHPRICEIVLIKALTWHSTRVRCVTMQVEMWRYPTCEIVLFATSMCSPYLRFLPCDSFTECFHFDIVLTIYASACIGRLIDFTGSLWLQSQFLKPTGVCI